MKTSMLGITATLWLTASIVVAQERPAAAISLDTYFQRNFGASAASDGQGALQLNSATAGEPSGESRGTVGSWSASTSAPAIFQRGTPYQSAQIEPVGRGVKPGTRTRRVAWQYAFLSSPPAGIHAYLCNYARCVGLSGASGSTTAFDGDDGWSYFSFAFVIDGRGALTPALQGSRSQVLVGYE